MKGVAVTAKHTMNIEQKETQPTLARVRGVNSIAALLFVNTLQRELAAKRVQQLLNAQANIIGEATTDFLVSNTYEVLERINQGYDFSIFLGEVKALIAAREAREARAKERSAAV